MPNPISSLLNPDAAHSDGFQPDRVRQPTRPENPSGCRTPFPLSQPRRGPFRRIGTGSGSATSPSRSQGVAEPDSDPKTHRIKKPDGGGGWRAAGGGWRMTEAAKKPRKTIQSQEEMTITAPFRCGYPSTSVAAGFDDRRRTTTRRRRRGGGEGGGGGGILAAGKWNMKGCER